jgi:hypothetical protein
VPWPCSIEPKLVWPDIRRPWPSRVVGYRVPLDTQVFLTSRQAKCSLVARRMAWLLPHVKLCDLRVWMLIMSYVPPSLFQTKCLGYKMLQSSNLAMQSLSQLRPRCCLYKNKRNAIEKIFHCMKHIWVHNAAPWLKCWPPGPMQQAITKNVQ